MNTTCTACGFRFPRPQARPTCQSERACARRAGTSAPLDVPEGTRLAVIALNAGLAATAAARAAAEPGFVPGGTMARRVALSAASALRHTSTPERAKAVLAEVLRTADVRDAAIAYIDELVLGA